MALLDWWHRSYTGYDKFGTVPKPGPGPSQNPADITVKFADVQLLGDVSVCVHGLGLAAVFPYCFEPPCSLLPLGSLHIAVISLIGPRCGDVRRVTDCPVRIEFSNLRSTRNPSRIGA